jgi:hypothetical protein
MKKDHENGQGDSALQDLFFEAMKLAWAAIALADDYSGGESETAQHLAKEYDKLNLKFDVAIDKRNAMHNAIVRAKVANKSIELAGEPWHGLGVRIDS